MLSIKSEKGANERDETVDTLLCPKSLERQIAAYSNIISCFSKKLEKTCLKFKPFILTLNPLLKIVHEKCIYTLIITVHETQGV